MIFQSTTRESILPASPGYGDRTVRPEDQMPWSAKFDTNQPIRADKPILSGFDWSYTPRPEYRPAANPILVDFRTDAEQWAIETDGECSVSDAARETLSWFDDDYRGVPEHVEHARKVLTRLAALG